MKLNAPTEVSRFVTPTEALSGLDRGAALLLDVRNFEEFAAEHARGASCIPLTDLDRRVGEIPTGQPVLVMCQSGARSAMGAERLRALGMDNIQEVKGGLDAWSKAGLPTDRQRSVMSLERQVRLFAGAFVLCFTVAGFARDRRFFYGAGFIGMMLSATAALNICPMLSALRLLPWNRINSDKA